jgi:hypothetical protein
MRMSPLGFRSSVAALGLSASLLAGCGGGHGSAGLPSVPGGGSGAGTSSVQAVTATFHFSFPKPTTSGTARAAAGVRGSAGVRTPKYLSSATKSVSLQVTDTKNAQTNADIYANVPAALKNVQSANFSNLTGTPTTPGQCGTDPNNAGNYECTVAFQMPVGIDTVTIKSWDANGATGNVLSQQEPSFTVVQGVSNTFSATLDANVNAMVVTATSGFCAGSFAVAASGTVGSVGTSTVNFNVSTTDADGKTIVAPGLPKISINGSSAASQTIDSGTITATINQASQTFSLAAASGTANGSVTVSIAPPNGGDGLSYSNSLMFTFQSGPAPGSGFLALIEQTNTTPGNAAGQVDLLTLNGWPNPTGFTNYSPATLTPTASKDVDNPQDMVFDTNGDLMIANGGAGSPDFGNFACIPAGAITAGASANATVITSTHLDDPASIAFGTDTSVAIASDAPYNGTTDDLDEFILSGTYAEASAARQVADSSFSGLSALNVVALPGTGANPAGSYAVSISNGSNPPTSNPLNQNPGGETPSTSEVVFKHPDGSTATLNDSDNTLGDAVIAYSPSTGHLITASGIANNNNNTATGTTAYLDAWNTTSGTQTSPVWSYVMVSAGTTPASSWFSPFRVAVSSSGYIAVGGEDQNGAMQVQVYNDGASAPTLQGAPIPFDGTTTSGGSTYAFDSSAGANGYVIFVNSLKFLTSTKLLIGLQTYDGTWQGFYIYDVSSLTVPAGGSQPCNPCYDQFGNAFGAGPTFVAFHHTTNHPLAAAFKP